MENIELSKLRSFYLAATRMEEFEFRDEENAVRESFSLKRILNSVRRLKFSLYLVLIVKALLPTIYSTVRISLLGDLPSDSVVNIASQVAWLSLFFEVLQEMLILPLYFTIGKSLNDPESTANKIKTGAMVIVVLFSVATVILYVTMPYLVTMMAQDSELFDQTVSYIRWDEMSPLSRLHLISLCEQEGAAGPGILQPQQFPTVPGPADGDEQDHRLLSPPQDGPHHPAGPHLPQ